MSKIIKITALVITLVIIGIGIYFYVSFKLVKQEMLEGTQKTARESMISSEMSKIPIAAENIYSKQKSYEDINCEHQSIRLICNEIKKLTENELIIHTSKERFCIYAKLPFQGKYLCIEYARTPFIYNTHHVITDPAEMGYCDGKTFICPPEE